MAKKKVKRVTRPKFKYGEAIVFDPKWKVEMYPGHPLMRKELVWFLGEIPNAPSHCIIVHRNSSNKDEVVTMVHTADFRKATEDEL